MIDLRDSTLAAQAAAEAASLAVRPDAQVQHDACGVRPAAEAVWLAAERDFLREVMALDEATGETPAVGGNIDA